MKVHIEAELRNINYKTNKPQNNTKRKEHYKKCIVFKT